MAKFVDSAAGAIEAGLSREVVVRLIQRGAVEGRREGSRYLVNVQELKRWAEAASSSKQSGARQLASNA